MANESPASILFDRDGYDLAIAPGDTITIDQPGFLTLGKDGSTARIITLDSSGRSIVVGAGSAGSPAGGFITIQGDAAGTPVPISAASLPLPSGASTEATLVTRLAEATFTSRINTLGQKTMANSTPVVISSDQSTITITGAVTASGTVTSNQGTAAALADAWPIKISDGSNYAPLTNAAPVGNEQGLVVRNIPSGTQVISGSVTATVSGTVTANQGTPASLSSPWPVQLSNGTNTPIITNTTPGGSDQALVVRNIPSGTQTISGTVTANAGSGTFTVSGTVAATQSGTWTVQPGNTANTTPWLTTINQGGNSAIVSGAGALKVDGSAVTQPVTGTLAATQSGTWTVQQGTPPWSVVGAAADGAAVTGNPVLVAGQDGTNVQSILTDSTGRIVIASAASAAQNGFSAGDIILASTTPTAIRSTTYTEPSVGAQRSIASSNVNDTSAGTGARTVRVTYYTLNAGTVAGPFTETITLNGTSSVNTIATDICYIEKMEVITVGSGGVNAGIITLFGTTGGGGGTVWTIAIGTNKTSGCHHYVPTNKICSITTFAGGIKGADTSGFTLRYKDPTNSNAAEIQLNDLIRAPSSGNTPIRPYSAPLKVTGPSRITGFAIPDSTSSRTYYASFDFYEE